MKKYGVAAFTVDKLPKKDSRLIELEQKLKIQQHIVGVSINRAKKSITITYHKSLITKAQLKDIIDSCGFFCKPLPLLSGKKALAIAEHKLKYKKR